MNKKVSVIITFCLISLLSIFSLNARRRNERTEDYIRESEGDVEIQLADEISDLPLVRSDSDETFDIDAKRQQVIRLIDEAGAYLQKQPLYEAMHAFTHSKAFQPGELYLFVYDMKGNTFASGTAEQNLWRNAYNLRDDFGAFLIRDILNVAKKGGGWVNYQWRGSAKVTYAKSFMKDDEAFVIAAGYYPHSKEAAVVNLVKGAVALFNETVANGEPLDKVFSTFSYPLGRFILGDLYLVAISFEGIIMAQGERPGLIGANTLEYRAGKQYVVKEIIQKLEKSNEGVWIEYLSKGAIKRAYNEMVVDSEGKKYYISCGYYPDAGQKEVVDLVRKAYTFMKGQGISEAVTQFSDLSNKRFRYGDLYIVLYNFDGVCKAHGTQRDLIGRNMFDDTDQNGQYFVREIIQKATELEKNGGQGGWLSFKLKNSFALVYLEPIDVGVDKFIITSMVYPVSKSETMILLGKSGASYLRTHPPAKAFREFVSVNGQFIRGDLTVFAFDSTGICLAWGDDYDRIWTNMIDEKDDNGKPYVKLLINTGMRGTGKVSYVLNGRPVVAYVEKVEKEGRNLIVGSSYFK